MASPKTKTRRGGFLSDAGAHAGLHGLGAQPPRARFVDGAADLRARLRDPAFRLHFEQRRLVHEVALAVRGMRKAAGLSQAELAAKIGVSQPMIARLEKGTDERTPRWDTLHRIAVALGRQLRLSFTEPTDGVPEHLLTVDGLDV